MSCVVSHNSDQWQQNGEELTLMFELKYGEKVDESKNDFFATIMHHYFGIDKIEKKIIRSREIEKTGLKEEKNQIIS